ncbi:MAG: IS21 family transposase [Candidatus Lokiarchaeota archaeon]|nr:IS21 family transposase [Candidatus Lokiarchaeota archaeon]
MRKDVENQLQLIKEVDLVNKSKLAKRFGCDRRTITRYLNGATSNREPRKYKSIIDNYKSIIIDKVDNYSATAMAVYKFIHKKGYTGSYLTVNNFVKKHINKQNKKATIRFETSPGLQAQVDWKEKVLMVNKNNEKFEVNIFLFVLGHSRLKYLKLTTDRKQKTLFECMMEAFKYINGVPREILFDNMKTVVNREKTTFNNVVLNNKFRSFCLDSGFDAITCRPYRPKTKGKVETLAKLVNRLKVYNGEFETYEDIENIVKSFNKEINNEISQGTNEIPYEKFKNELEYLNPLPNIDILKSYFCQEKEYLVYPDSMVKYKGKKYSVPIHLIGKNVNIKEKNNFINVYYMKDFIVSHLNSEELLNYKLSHVKEILRSDALSNCSDGAIDDFIEEKLKKMDIILN